MGTMRSTLSLTKNALSGNKPGNYTGACYLFKFIEKMKKIEPLFLYTLLILLCSSWSWPQIAEEVALPDGKHTTDKSPERIQKAAAVSVRFTDTAMGYLDWKDLNRITGEYQVRYRTKDLSNEWTEVNTSATELIIDNLALDTEYRWEVRAAAGEEMITSGQGLLSTFAQQEPIQVSDALFRPLYGWFAQQEDQEPFCNYLDRLRVHPLEKLAFLQAYSFGNAPLRKQADFDDFNEWYPMSHRDMDCSGFARPKDRGDELTTNCRCQVITRGLINTAPFEAINDEVITPTEENYAVGSSRDRTYAIKLQAGAAKYIALHQDESGGDADYALSNLPGSDASRSVSTSFSEISFLLGCLKKGGFSTLLPEKCQCSRSVDVGYQYTTRLHIKAREKVCVWHKAAAAQAEEYAFLMAFNAATGDLTAIDGGHAILGRWCNSSWQPDFSMNSFRVVRPVMDEYLNTLAAQTKGIEGEDLPTVSPTEEQQDDFREALREVCNPPFNNTSGDCADSPLVEEHILIHGTERLLLHPNQPLFVALFSNHYVRTKGFGCYVAEASIASDYRLTGVVQSTSTSRECCRDKLGVYRYGSLSAPPYSRIHNNAVNSMNVRRLQVSNFLATYGDWSDQSPLPTGDGGLPVAYGHWSGPDCKWSPDQPGLRSLPETSSQSSRFQVYPTTASDQVTLRISEAVPTGARIRVVNAQGQEVYRDLLRNGGAALIQKSIGISDWVAGPYWLEVVNGSETNTLPFQKI